MENVLVWLEDKPDTIDEVLKHARKSGFFVKTLAKPIQVGDFLVESGKDVEELSQSEGAVGEGKRGPKRIAGLVVDIMLFGVNDLSDLGITASDTDAGFEAGWVFLHRYLRAPGSPYADIPVLILSIRRMDHPHEELCNEIRSRGGASLEVIQKFQDDTSWRFREWLDNLRKKVDAVSSSVADKSERK